MSNEIGAVFEIDVPAWGADDCDVRDGWSVGGIGRYFQTGAAFWMNLQTSHDISVVEAEKGQTINLEIAATV